MIISLDILVYVYYSTHISADRAWVRLPPVSFALPCRWRAGFPRGVRGRSLTSGFCPALCFEASAKVVVSSLWLDCSVANR